ncbi:unnamed protein product [Tetraodon nigroviridis]|uniref:(spotted green pufferfish) hypothetical protein n=1 Tax=Tetraodon nigroviridis TaxID=99883 RepID=Q4SXP2_TETNG|nr:unnamed protein product [Tetraodon nigroviridis]
MDMAGAKTLDLLVGVVLVLQCVRNVHAGITTGNDLLKGPTLNGRWGVGWYAGVSGGSGGSGLCAVTVGRAIHGRGSEAGSSPRSSMRQQGRAPALVTPGSCR